MLSDISVEVTRIVLISFIILGTIGNALNLFIFTRPTLLRSSCTLYLIAASIDNILVIYTSLLTRLLAQGFSYDVAAFSNLICKLRYYFGYIFFALSPYFYILASFDRYCSSSASTTRRAWSNKKVAKRYIIGAIVVACILYSHMPIFFELYPTATGISCYSRPGIYSIFYRIFYLIIYCLFPSVCMGLLCGLTLLNIRRQSRQVRPMLVTTNAGHRRLDRQMIRLLFAQILTQVLCILPFATLSLVGMFINTNTTIYTFLNQMFILPLFVSYTTSFYVFTMSSRVYRQELSKLIRFRQTTEDTRKFTLGAVITGTNIYPRAKTQENDQELNIL